LLLSELPSGDRVSTDRPTAAEQWHIGNSALIRLLRPRQWSKNLLVFAAAVFADQLFVARSAGLACLAFVAFCLASSSVYVVNDLVDVERDRQHPKKRLRPIATGEISPGAAVRIAVALTLAALGIAVWVSWELAATIAVYIALVHFYSTMGKHIVILDTMLVAAGFVIRAVGGAIAIDVPSSSWFILCTFFAALFLALAKRRAEMLALNDGAGEHRSVLGEYTESTLSTYTSAVIAATTISYALYVIDSADTFRLLPLTVPFVLFAVFRYHHLVETAGLGERPEDVFLGDRAFQTGVVAFLAAALAAIYWGP
jgi:4-hydroxybenzoate polyprenyltransferase